MKTRQDPVPTGKPAGCTFFHPAAADWIYPVAGYCKGQPKGLLMIPSLEEYHTYCSTPDYTACRVYRLRCGEESAETPVPAAMAC